MITYTSSYRKRVLDVSFLTRGQVKELVALKKAKGVAYMADLYVAMKATAIRKGHTKRAVSWRAKYQ